HDILVRHTDFEAVADLRAFLGERVVVLAVDRADEGELLVQNTQGFTRHRRRGEESIAHLRFLRASEEAQGRDASRRGIWLGGSAPRTELAVASFHPLIRSQPIIQLSRGGELTALGACWGRLRRGGGNLGLWCGLAGVLRGNHPERGCLMDRWEVIESYGIIEVGREVVCDLWTDRG